MYFSCQKSNFSDQSEYASGLEKFFFTRKVMPISINT
jgi:hypothetical protein